MRNIKSSDYLVNAKLTRMLDTKFDSDLYTRDFKSCDFGTYLCALAYASIGKELFSDAKITGALDNMQQDSTIRLDRNFFEGMVTYSVLSKIAAVQEVMSSSEFEKTKTLDMSKIAGKNDYATQAFALYYAYTKGYVCDWDHMNHSYSELNFSYDPKVQFKDVGKETDPKSLVENVMRELKTEPEF